MCLYTNIFMLLRYCCYSGLTELTQWNLLLGINYGSPGFPNINYTPHIHKQGLPLPSFKIIQNQKWNPATRFPAPFTFKQPKALVLSITKQHWTQQQKAKQEGKGCINPSAQVKPTNQFWALTAQRGVKTRTKSYWNWVFCKRTMLWGFQDY